MLMFEIIKQEKIKLIILLLLMRIQMFLMKIMMGHLMNKNIVRYNYSIIQLLSLKVTPKFQDNNLKIDPILNMKIIIIIPKIYNLSKKVMTQQIVLVQIKKEICKLNKHSKPLDLELKIPFKIKYEMMIWIKIILVLEMLHL